MNKHLSHTHICAMEGMSFEGVCVGLYGDV